MKSFYVSAKTGDNVSTCFHKVAADLAGITLTKPEVLIFIFIFCTSALFSTKLPRTLLQSPSLSLRFSIFKYFFLYLHARTQTHIHTHKHTEVKVVAKVVKAEVVKK
jgi:hypothetical protein